MRKFVIQSKKGKTSITEVEVEIIQPLEDPSVMQLPSEEYRARILAPQTFYQCIEKVLIPDVWYSHAFCDGLVDAWKKTEELIRQEFEFNKRKYGKEFTEEEVQAATNAVEVVMLRV